MKELKRRTADHLRKEQEFLVNQLELISKESCNPLGGMDLAALTDAMLKVLKVMSVPYALRIGIVFAVITHLTAGFLVLVIKFFRRREGNN